MSDDPKHPLYWLGAAGLSGGAILGFAAANMRLGPVLGGFLWLGVLVMALVAVNLVPKLQKPLKVLGAIAVVILIGSLWHVASPHADIQIVRKVPSLQNGRARVAIYFKNVGQYEAHLVPSQVTDHALAENVLEPTFRSVMERKLHQQNCKLQSQGEPEGGAGLLDKDHGNYIVETWGGSEMSPDQWSAFFNGGDVLYASGQIRYWDWWSLTDKTTEYCFWLERGGRIVACGLYNTSSASCS